MLATDLATSDANSIQISDFPDFRRPVRTVAWTLHLAGVVDCRYGSHANGCRMSHGRAGSNQTPRGPDLSMMLLPLLFVAAGCESTAPTSIGAQVDQVVLSAVLVEPGFVEVFSGDTVLFVAEAYDIANEQIPAEFDWQTSGGTVSDGLFVAGTTEGEFEVFAEPTKANGKALAKGHEKSGSARVRVKTNGGNGNRPPDVSFSHSCSGRSCSFDGSGSNDPDGSVSSHDWNFGDGASGSGAAVEHTYQSAGDYSVELRVTDDSAAVSTQTRTITVESESADPTNELPTASIEVTCVDLECSFDGSGSSDADGSIASFSWKFGDGATAAGAKPAHEYAKPGADRFIHGPVYQPDLRV
jgi:chitodextrinase/plastocyanin